MNDILIENLIRQVKTVGPEDTIGRAAEALRVFGLTELPIISGSRVVGIVTESSVLDALIAGDPKVMAEKPVREILSERVVCVNRYLPIGQVAEIMRDHDLQIVPIVDEYGGYLGVVTRSDVASALRQTIRPPVIGGLATPIGVYLTTGRLSAGAGKFGLFLAGAFMVLMMFVATWVVLGAAWLVQEFTPVQLWNIVNSPAMGANKLNWMYALGYLMRGLILPVWMLLIRLSPISGYHAAEHQVVHAIENGESLTPANVQAMPRAHPRCGTNIFAGMILFLIMANVFSDETAILVTVLVLVFAWRAVGGFFQYYVTTKTANRRQIESGIKAGESLLEKYRKNPGGRMNGFQRIWGSGMPMVMLGAAAMSAVGELLKVVPPSFF